MISLYLSTLLLWTCTDANKKSQTFHHLILIQTESQHTIVKCYEHFICIMYQYAKGLLRRDGEAVTGQEDQFQNSICRLDKMGGRFQYQSVKVLQCHHPSYNFKYFLQNLNKTTFGFMTSNVSKCAQTFSASVMIYLQLIGLVLQCHFTASNAVKRSQIKSLGFMAYNVSKSLQKLHCSDMTYGQND